MELDASAKLGNIRSERYAMIIDVGALIIRSHGFFPAVREKTAVISAQPAWQSLEFGLVGFLAACSFFPPVDRHSLRMERSLRLPRARIRSQPKSRKHRVFRSGIQPSQNPHLSREIKTASTQKKPMFRPDNFD